MRPLLSHRTALATLVVAAGTIVATSAGAQTTVTISVDATAAGTALEKVWPYHGYDEVNYSTTAEGKALLGTLGSIDTTADHIRTHFLLNTGNGTASLKWGSTNAYTEDSAGNPIYSWTILDGIMDAITGAGAFPLAEIAFMPQALSTKPTPYMDSGVGALDGGCFYPPKDYTKWGGLISAWATHENARYPNVASTWLWELWNEPDINYWHGTFAEYAKLYDYTESALHGVMATAPLGGPAVASAGGTFLTQFLQHCATGTNAVSGKTGTRLDLVSFHAKGGTAVTGGHVEMNLGNQLRLHQSGMNAVAGVAMFKQTPIYITEADPDGCAACPATTTPADAYRNSPAYGAYEVAMMKRTIELEARIGVKLGGLLTWAFTFPGTPYFAGYRALATNGIHLPVLGTFKLLGALDGTRLPVTSSGALTLDAILNNSVRGQADVDAMATVNGQSVQVLVWNYHDDLVTAASAPVQVNVKVPASFGARVSATHLRVDDTHGDAYPIWMSQGSPAAPSATQIAALQQGMDPVSLAAQTLDVAGGSVSLSFDLPRFGISLVTLTPAPATGDGGVDAPVDASVDRPDDAATSDAPAGSDAAARDGSAGTGGAGTGGAGTAGAGGGGGRGGASGGGGNGRGAAGTAGGGASGASGGGAAGAAGSGAAGSGAAGSGAAGSGAAGSGAAGSGAVGSGCGCAVEPASGAPGTIALLVLGLALVSRRARTRSARARSGRPGCGRAGAGCPARAPRTAGRRRRSGSGRA
jgi:xylan 1,4-beta-xylosidase